LRTLADSSVDAVVTDPPYGLAFMGKRWDYDVPAVDVWAECLRVLKPGGHLLAFGGTRTYHRMAVRIEDAGFEIRDMIAWVYGSGFPKSLDVSKAIDKAAGAEREVVGVSSVTGARHSRTMDDGNKGNRRTYQNEEPVINTITAPATDAARQWSGWGTALKPAMEPITVARKPLIGTVAENVLAHGTGGINVDGCRVATDPAMDDPRLGGAGTWSSDKMAKNVYEGGYAGDRVGSSPLGRWPANLIHDGSEEPTNLLGDAARFFYCPKASKADRDEGCEGLEFRTAGEMVDREEGSAGIQNPRAGAGRTGGGRNAHPTVKPVALMRYLCRLVTPPGGVVLDPFTGSGSTGKAAILERFNFIGIEREAEYVEIAKARIEAAKK
jgi:site-specific DNA-methyltransferase (adenine-specific)